MAQSLSVTGITTGGKKSSKTLTYINPEATNAQLQGLAIAYNNLSNKIYDSGERTIKTNINDPEPGTKPEPTITLGTVDSDGGELSKNIKFYRIDYTYNGDGEISFTTANRDSLRNIIGISKSTDVENRIFIVKYYTNNSNSTIELTVYASEGENYAAKKITQTITLSV